MNPLLRHRFASRAHHLLLLLLPLQHLVLRRRQDLLAGLVAVAGLLLEWQDGIGHCLRLRLHVPRFEHVRVALRLQCDELALIVRSCDCHRCIVVLVVVARRASYKRFDLLICDRGGGGLSGEDVIDYMKLGTRAPSRVILGQPATVCQCR